MAQNLHYEGSAQTTNPLLQALRVEDQLKRHKEIAEILDELDEDKAVTLLFDALLKSIDNGLRKRVVEELKKIGSTRAVELLGSIMTDDFDPEVQRGAVEALRRIGSDKAVDALLSVLRSGNPWSRREAGRVLGEFNSDRVADALMEASKDYFIADTAVLSLAKIGSDRAIEHLITIMQDLVHETGTTGLTAMEGLVRLGTDKAVDGILTAWISPISIQGDRLYFHLGQFKPKNLITPLSQRLQDKTLSVNIRKAAAEMLGIIGTENEIPLLKSVWREEDDKDVGWRALRSAEQIALSELEKRAERERALEETRALIVHGFRHALTPLNAYIKMFDKVLAEPEIDKEGLSSLAARIRRQTNVALDLVNRYMHYTRPLAPEFVPADIKDLMEQVLEEFKPDLESREIRLTTQFFGDATAEVEKDALCDVLRNLVINSIQAIDRDGALDIAVDAHADIVLIKIHDTGIGIKPEHASHVFDFGFTTDPKGTGFGLWWSKRIIEAHSGSIAVANNTDGPGVAIVITLPKKKTEITNGRHDLTLADR